MFLPVCKEDLEEREISQLDFVMVSGDAYICHHSFGSSLIARLFESLGYSVGMIAQPKDAADYKKLGMPRLGFLVSGGVVDSMVNNYTVAKIRRTEDSYSPKGQCNTPDRATIEYCKQIRKAFGDIAIIVGGVEPSLRRFSHYDYWSDTVMPSILVDCTADLLIYGMGEKPVMEICKMLDRNIPIKKMHDIVGTAYISECGAKKDYMVLPSHEEVKNEKLQFAKAFSIQSRETDGRNAKGLIQKCGNKFIVQNPPAIPLTEKEMDFVYAMPFERNYHPMYEKFGGVPALEEVKFSITSHRGCFGSCSFCSLNYHQGRAVQKRSEESILAEASTITQMTDFKGYIHDVGGPSANFRNPACDKQKISGVCKDKYCIGAKKCANLTVSHKEYLGLLQKIRKIPKIKKVFIRSGIRFDYLMYDSDPQFFNELVKYHISGQLKIAPEHISDNTLSLMNKSNSSIYKEFSKKYKLYNDKQKTNQFLVPYFISSHPGCTLKDAIKLAEYLKSINYMPMQVQDFYPTPSTRSTCMYYTGIDPDSMKEVYVPKTKEEKQLQRALLQYRKKENYYLVQKALRQAGRDDLIGFSPSCLIRPMQKQK